MIVLGAKSAVIVGLILAAWLAAAVYATMIGLARLRSASTQFGDARRLRSLIGAAPALHLLVKPSGGISADRRVAQRFGLADPPQTLADILAALATDEALILSRAITAAQRAGSTVSLPLTTSGGRTLSLVGGPAPAALGGGVLLWLYDMSDSQQRVIELEREGARLGTALDAFATLVEAAPIPMWHRGPDLRLSVVNSAYVRAVEGDDAADVVARGLELVDGGGFAPITSAAAAGEAGDIQVRSLPATVGGARRMLRVVDVPLGDSGIAGYALDIEELEEARADLSRFALAQRDMLDRLSAGVAQFGADRGLVFWNRPFLRLFAMKPEWLSDRPEFDRVLDRMREAGRLPESRDFPGWRAERRGWFMAADAAEENWLLPDGLHLRVVAQPLPDGGLLLIFEDRTEQVKLESARDTLLRVRTATFNNLFEAIGVFAADGRLHLWNHRFQSVWGLSEAELAEHPRVDALVNLVAKRLANPARAGLIRELVRVATAERQQRSGRVTLTDGRQFEFAAVPLPDGNALFTMLDITDSRRIEQALRERNEALEEGDKVKTSFVATMSYELRTPLTSIGGFAEMLEAGYAGPLGEQAREYVDAILQSVARLGTLIDQVLDLTQSAAGGLPMAEEPVDLVRLAGEVVERHRAAAAERKLALVVTIDASAGTVTGDARRLAQAIDHVLRNAVGYTPPGGRVLFHAEGDDAEARLVVSDDGEGIAAPEKARVFDRFHRAALRGAEGGALGLGLPLTRQFVEAHGGTVELTSETGKGTTVAIVLPRRRAA